MPWSKHVGEGKHFATPEAYATEIKRKDATGQQFTDQSAADAFRQAHPNYFQTQQPAQAPQQTPGVSNITSEYTPEVSSLLQQLRDYLGTPHQTPDQVMQSDYGQQLMGSADAIRDQQMRHARAQLAGSGALYPDDTRAAERFADVGAEAARMQAGQILPQLLAATQGQRAAGLNELMTGLGAHHSAEGNALSRILQTFQTAAPYYLTTEEFRQRQPYDWTSMMGQVPGGAVPAGGGGGGTVPARQYVEQKGGQIAHRKAPDGTDIVTINGHDIPVQSIPGAYIENGRTFLPQWVIDQALGG